MTTNRQANTVVESPARMEMEREWRERLAAGGGSVWLAGCPRANQRPAVTLSQHCISE